jgi:hypothetical protein
VTIQAGADLFPYVFTYKAFENMLFPMGNWAQDYKTTISNDIDLAQHSEPEALKKLHEVRKKKICFFLNESFVNKYLCHVATHFSLFADSLPNGFFKVMMKRCEDPGLFSGIMDTALFDMGAGTSSCTSS